MTRVKRTRKVYCYIFFVPICWMFFNGCARTHHVTDIGIRYFQMQEADPNTYSILLGKFPQINFSGYRSVLGHTTMWLIRKAGSNSCVWLSNGRVHIFDHPCKRKDFVHSFHNWPDQDYYAFLAPAGQYTFEYHYPVGGEYSKTRVLAYTRELSVTPGKIIYMGTHNPAVKTERRSDGIKTTSMNQYLRMDISSNYEDDIGELRKKYPEVFSQFDLVVKDSSM
jgi:hypothetical protein